MAPSLVLNICLVDSASFHFQMSQHLFMKISVQLYRILYTLLSINHAILINIVFWFFFLFNETFCEWELLKLFMYIHDFFCFEWRLRGLTQVTVKGSGIGFYWQSVVAIYKTEVCPMSSALSINPPQKSLGFGASTSDPAEYLPKKTVLILMVACSIFIFSQLTRNSC